ncbi:hypothetical protein KBD08_02390 [Candidatus Babeliales bacterium]|nr:hypothetical protein [Candidatus Babeliales bacterium]
MLFQRIFLVVALLNIGSIYCAESQEKYAYIRQCMKKDARTLFRHNLYCGFKRSCRKAIIPGTLFAAWYNYPTLKDMTLDDCQKFMHENLAQLQQCVSKDVEKSLDYIHARDADLRKNFAKAVVQLKSNTSQFTSQTLQKAKSCLSGCDATLRQHAASVVSHIKEAADNFVQDNIVLLVEEQTHEPAAPVVEQAAASSKQSNDSNAVTICELETAQPTTVAKHNVGVVQDVVAQEQKSIASVIEALVQKPIEEELFVDNVLVEQQSESVEQNKKSMYENAALRVSSVANLLKYDQYGKQALIVGSTIAVVAVGTYVYKHFHKTSNDELDA